jgi:phosphopantothenoylcysteine decarboxylase/phosphopantothenate--cysteine ligase
LVAIRVAAVRHEANPMANQARAGRFIVLGVSGGIAVYKVAELVRLLTALGHRVQVVMTAHAQEFVRPLTFASLTGQKVITELFSSSSGEATLDSAIEHIGVAQKAELLLVAPATANVLAKLANGLADDFLTTMYLAYQGPVVVAPAMNTNMWNHPATRRNLALLRERGARVVEPDEGELACGVVGPGRLAVLENIVAAAEDALHPRRDLAGETVLITAGPTEEPLDPVRFLSNRSSGRMGYALASEAQSRGARVIVVSGRVAIEPPAGCEIVAAATAEQMHKAVLARLPESTIVIMAAAVADYRPARVETRKIKKQAGNPVAIELEPTTDILKAVGERKGARLLIGFAAETENLVANAKAKLEAKNCDLIVANPVGPEAGGAGIDSHENQGWILAATGEKIQLERSSKREMARSILDHALALRPALARTRAWSNSLP